MPESKPALSIILPANNEAQALPGVLEELKTRFPDAELIVVDDGSTDATAELAAAAGARVIRHPYPTGNGAAIKSGARAARGETLLFMDADGQHRAGDAQRLINTLSEGYDMVVGARDAVSQASLGRKLANGFYNRLASWIVGHRIADLTSGFRAARAARFREFLYLLPNGFSYPTTITMAFFRAGYHVAYAPITAHPRLGRSHIQPFRDGLRFLLIIFRIGTLYSPLKVFLPFSLAFFLTGLGYYLYKLFTVHRFTNMSALLFIAAILIFLIGLVSEQITNLLYRPPT
ncbi:MAG TPA: glycosyltransferase family 2 protein [Gammaproteobacteria bacterium]|nr:glycosyltransferase family 2 protein [Gammaproteobacteria bacterium]